MIGSIREILDIKTVEDMQLALQAFDKELEDRLAPLCSELDKNIFSQDVSSVSLHMGEVESWRARVVRYLSLATGFVQHAKSSGFLPMKDKATSELDRDAFQRKLAGGFTAWQVRLEGIVDCIDSRVNLAKKFLGIEIEGSNGRQKKLVG